MYYLILLLVVILITFVFSHFKVNIKSDTRYLKVIFLILILFLGLRGSTVGLDMVNYNDFFILASTNPLGFLISNVEFEIGFKLFTKFITLFTNNFSVYIFIISIISMIGVYTFIRDNSKNYFASIFLFITFNYFIYYTCTLRQCMTISFLLYAYSFLKGGKFIWYFIIVLISSTFHKTSLVLLLLPIFKYFKFDNKKIFCFVIFCILLFFIKEPVINFLTNTIYRQYINFGDTSGSGYMMLFLILSLICGVLFMCKKNKISYNEENKYLFGMFLLTLPFQVMSTYQGLIARIVLYFLYSIIILIPNVIEMSKVKYRKILYPLFYCFLFIFYIYQIFTNSVYVDYEFLWF